MHDDAKERLLENDGNDSKQQGVDDEFKAIEGEDKS